MSDDTLAQKPVRLSKFAAETNAQSAAKELKASAPRLEDHVMIFHAGCGGIVTGELGKPLKCAECGKEMTAFVSSEEEAQVEHGKALPAK